MALPPENTQERRRFWPVAALVVVFAAFCALGVWQVKRLAWKEALIARVHAGLAGAPADAARFAGRPAQEYSKLRATGIFEPRATVLVRASTALGPGFWAMAPLRLPDGRAIWVNRGFVPDGSGVTAVARSTPAGEVTLVGLLRLDEPRGTWLRANRPAEGRWYSRDLAAMAAKEGVSGSETAWFVDQGLPKSNVTVNDDDEIMPARSTPAPGSTVTPVPGLTVIRFPNNHLSYAITWFLLAGSTLVGLAIVLRRPGRTE